MHYSFVPNICLLINYYATYSISIGRQSSDNNSDGKVSDAKADTSPIDTHVNSMSLKAATIDAISSSDSEDYNNADYSPDGEAGGDSINQTNDNLDASTCSEMIPNKNRVRNNCISSDENDDNDDGNDDAPQSESRKPSNVISSEDEEEDDEDEDIIDSTDKFKNSTAVKGK